MDGHVLVARDLHGSEHEHLRPRRRHLEHLLVGDRVELAGVGNDARVGGEHAQDVGVDLARGTERRGERDRRRVGAATAERCHVHRVAREARKPATRTILPAVERTRPRETGVISRIFAFVCTGSVMIPACEPVNETAS